MFFYLISKFKINSDKRYIPSEIKDFLKETVFIPSALKSTMVCYIERLDRVHKLEITKGYVNEDIFPNSVSKIN